MSCLEDGRETKEYIFPDFKSTNDWVCFPFVQTRSSIGCYGWKIKGRIVFSGTRNGKLQKARSLIAGQEEICCRRQLPCLLIRVKTSEVFTAFSKSHAYMVITKRTSEKEKHGLGYLVRKKYSLFVQEMLSRMTFLGFSLLLIDPTLPLLLITFVPLDHHI